MDDHQRDTRPSEPAWRAAVADVRAPDRLQRAVAESVRARREAPARRGAVGVRIGGALAAAAAAVVLLLALPGGTPGTPTVVEAANLGARDATSPAPAVDPRRPGLLQMSLGGVAYPNWAGRYGWRAVGARRDRLDGRVAVTVFYANHAGRRLAYTIVGGAPLRLPSGRDLERDGLALRALPAGSRHVVTWRRGGHTCVLSASGVATDTLARLAAWSGYRDGGRDGGSRY
jgi:hypothetical protein